MWFLLLRFLRVSNEIAFGSVKYNANGLNSTIYNPAPMWQNIFLSPASTYYRITWVSGNSVVFQWRAWNLDPSGMPLENNCWQPVCF